MIRPVISDWRENSRNHTKNLMVSIPPPKQSRRAFYKVLEALIVLELKKLESIILSQGPLPLILVKDGLSWEPVQQCHIALTISMFQKVISSLWSHWFTENEGQGKVCHVLPWTWTCAITFNHGILAQLALRSPAEATLAWSVVSRKKERWHWCLCLGQSFMQEGQTRDWLWACLWKFITDL